MGKPEDWVWGQEPRHLFSETLSSFHKKLGDRAFWRNPDSQEIAIEALGQDYLRTEHGKFLKQDAVSLQAAFDEYSRRKIYMEVYI